MSKTELAFQEGHISTAMVWTTMVLIIQGGGDCRWIELLEVICKVCAYIMNNRLRAVINLHNNLNGCRQGRGAGMTTMEENLEQQPAGIRKAYGYFDGRRFMEILNGYGLGPNLQRLLKWYWDEKKLVPKAGKFCE